MPNTVTDPLATARAKLTDAMAHHDKARAIMEAGRVLMREAFALIDAPAAPAELHPAVTTGEGPDVLVLHVSQDAFDGDAQFKVTVGGRPMGATFTAKASKKAEESQRFVFRGAWPAGRHEVAVQFLNDKWGGTPGTDRNLYVTGATFNGAAVPGSKLDLLNQDKALSFVFVKP